MGNNTTPLKPYYLEVATGFNLGNVYVEDAVIQFPPLESWNPMPGTETDEEIIWTASPLDTLWGRVRELEPDRYIQWVEQTTEEGSFFIVFCPVEPYVCYRLVPVEDIDELVENKLYETPLDPAKNITVLVQDSQTVGVVVGTGLLRQILKGELQIHFLHAEDTEAVGQVLQNGVGVSIPEHPYTGGE